MSQPQRKWLGMLSDLHSTLWELKAYIFRKCQGFVIMHLIFPLPAGGSSLCSVEETDFNPSQLNTSFAHCEPQQGKQANKQTKNLNERGICRRARAMEMCAEITARKRSSLMVSGEGEGRIPPGRIEDTHTPHQK